MKKQNLRSKLQICLILLLSLTLYPAAVHAEPSELDPVKLFISPISDSNDQALGNMFQEIITTPAEEFIRRIEKNTIDPQKKVALMKWIVNNWYYELAQEQNRDPILKNECIAKAKVLLNRAITISQSGGLGPDETNDLTQTLNEFSEFRERPVSQIEINDYFAQSALLSLSLAAETFAANHGGAFPSDIHDLMGQDYPFLKTPYCSQQPQSGFILECNFRDSGYSITAKPLRKGQTGTSTLTVENGGHVHEVNDAS